MSISDEAMWEYYRLLLLESEEGLKQMKQAHPMVTKKELAKKTNRSFLKRTVLKKNINHLRRYSHKDKLHKKWIKSL